MKVPSEAHIIKVLLDISREMVETRALDPLLTYAVEQCMTLFDAELGYLVLINADNTLDYRVQLAANGEEINDPEQRISRTIFSKAVNTGEPVLIISALDDPEFQNSESVVQMQLRSVLCVPLVSRAKSIGVVYLENRSADHIFTKEYIEPLRYFASQTAAVIENAILNEAMETKIAARTSQIRETNKRLELEIAERQRIEQEFISVAVERERSHILNRFIQNASHQFRTPLSVIQVSLKLLQTQYDISADDQHATQIKTQVNTVAELLNNMVLMVKLDTDGFQNTLYPIQMNELIEIMRSRWMDAINKREHRLHIALADDLPTFTGDAELLTKALDHLIINAIQYTRSKGEISITTAQQGDLIIVQVKDTGEGIPQNSQSAIFQRFFRGDEAGTTRGFGLGLSIAQLIVQLHAGSLTLESQPGQGSTFTIEIPTKH